MINRYFKQLKTILVGFDILSFIIAFWMANEIRTFQIGAVLDKYTRNEYLVIGFISLIIIIFIFNYIGLYKMEVSYSREAFLVIKAITLSFTIIFGLSFFYRSGTFFTISRLFYSYLAFICLILTLINRGLFRKLIKYLGNIKPIQRNIVVVGCGVVGKTLIDALLMRPSVWRLSGYLDDCDSAGAYKNIHCLGKLSQLSEVVINKRINDVFICIPSAPRQVIKSLIQKCESLNINWRVVPNLYDLPIDIVHFDRLNNLPLVGPRATNIVGVNLLVKRIFDFIFSSLMIALVAPLMIVIAIAIKLSSPGPVLFRQVREN
jgi:FlaA1/EpsC-like NDP-sugar epimerase